MQKYCAYCEHWENDNTDHYKDEAYCDTMKRTCPACQKVCSKFSERRWHGYRVDDNCSNCAFWCLDGVISYGNQAYCDQDNHTHPENERACRYFIKHPNGGYKRAGIPWYITSIICRRLGYPQNCHLLQTTSHLRTDYLSQTEEGRAFLAKYDIFGSIIACQLMYAPMETIISLLERFIEPCYNAILKSDILGAIEIYQNMFAELYSKAIQPSQNLIRK